MKMVRERLPSISIDYSSVDEEFSVADLQLMSDMAESRYEDEDDHTFFARLGLSSKE